LEKPKAKKMPSEHRITGMKPGEVQHIKNDHGEYLLVHLVHYKGDYGYEFVDLNKTVAGIIEYSENHNTMMQDAVDEKTRDYRNDNQES
jgi:hypothetical protein